MKTARPPKGGTHPFVPNPAIPADHTGQTFCAVKGCGRPKRNACHQMPDNPSRDGDARWLGEGRG